MVNIERNEVMEEPFMFRQVGMLEKRNKELLQLMEMSADTLETVLQRIRAGMEEAATVIILPENPKVEGMINDIDDPLMENTDFKYSTEISKTGDLQGKSEVGPESEPMFNNLLEDELDQIKIEIFKEEAAITKKTLNPHANIPSLCGQEQVANESSASVGREIEGVILYRSSQTQIAAENHMEQENEGMAEELQKKYFCKYCNYSALESNNLTKHIQTKHYLLRYPCDECDHKALNLFLWKTHKVNKHNKEWWRCVQCKYSSLKKDNLEMHVLSHTDPETTEHLNDAGQFPCDLCQYIGLSQIRLNYHMRLRHTESKYEAKRTRMMKQMEEEQETQQGSPTGNKKEDTLEEDPEEGGEVSLPGKRKHSCSRRYPCNQCDEGLTNLSGVKKPRHEVESSPTVPVDGADNTVKQGFLLFKSKTKKKTKLYSSLICNTTPTLYSCDECTYSDSTLLGLRSHKKYQHNDDSFKCEQCEFRSKYISHLKEHKKMHYSKTSAGHQIRIFYCEYCEYSNCDQTNVIRHRKTKHPSEKNSTRKIIHQNLTVGKSTAKKTVQTSSPCQGITCNECGFKASTLEALVIHGRVKHEADKLLCDQCEYSTVKQAYLKKHFEVKHDGVRLKCNQCEYTAANKRTLINHEATEHNGVRFLCDLCGFAGKSAMNLQYHTTSTHQGVRYQCDLCDFKTTTNGYLKFHKEYKHQGMVLSCDQCEFTTPHRTALKLHKTGVHEGVVYSCDQCSYSTVSKHKFRRHVAGKHEGKTIKCDECDFSVPYNSNLKKHKDSVHRGLMNCDQCDYVATRNVYLKRHKLKKHCKTKSYWPKSAIIF